MGYCPNISSWISPLMTRLLILTTTSFNNFHLWHFFFLFWNHLFSIIKIWFFQSFLRFNLSFKWLTYSFFFCVENPIGLDTSWCHWGTDDRSEMSRKKKNTALRWFEKEKRILRAKGGSLSYEHKKELKMCLPQVQRPVNKQHTINL